MAHQQLDLARHGCLADRHVDVGPAEVAVPLRDLVLQDQVVAERVPGQPAHLAVVLVRVVAVVGQDHSGWTRPLRLSNQALISARSAGKKPSRNLCTSTRARSTPSRKSAAEARASASRGPAADSTHHSHVEPHAGCLPLQDGAAGADLDVVGVRAQAQHGQALAGLGQPQALHSAASTGLLDSFGCQGMSPRSTMSSSICLSLSVSMARKKPSWR